MVFEEYIENLKKMLDKNPEFATLDVIAATDDEGNDYNSVYFAPKEEFKSLIHRQI